MGHQGATTPDVARDELGQLFNSILGIEIHTDRSSNMLLTNKINVILHKAMSKVLVKDFSKPY